MGQSVGPPIAQPMNHHMQTPSSATSRTAVGSFSDAAQSPLGPAPMGQNFSSGPGPVPVIPAAQRPSSRGQHERSFSHSSGYSQSNMAPPPQQQYPTRNSVQMAPAGQTAIPNSRFNTSNTGAPGPPQLGALSFQGPQQPSQPQQPPPPSHQQAQLPPLQGPSNPLMQNPPANRPGSKGQSQPPAPQLAPSKPVFGISLGRLYERDNMAVPMVVYQCIQAVDLFGLNVEGIYRLSGSLPHVNRLKAMFDTGEASIPLLGPVGPCGC